VALSDKARKWIAKTQAASPSPKVRKTPEGVYGTSTQLGINKQGVYPAGTVKENK